MPLAIKVIYSFTNELDGLVSFVTEANDEFFVSLKDTDAKRFLPTSFKYDSLKDAKEKALQLVITLDD